jgi:hypothetical protein
MAAFTVIIGNIISTSRPREAGGVAKKFREFSAGRDQGVKTKTRCTVTAQHLNTT